MDERRLGEKLRDVEIPDATGARARARRTALAAHAVRPRNARRRVSARVVAVAAFTIAIGTVTAAVGPHATAQWVRTKLSLSDRLPADRVSASLVDLPGGGRLLVNAGDSVWIIGQGPSKRIPGTADQVGWSAFGRYLLRAHGRQVQALSTDGRVAWTQRYSRTVSFPTWSRDGNRVAFRVGRAMQITAGDGTASRPLRPRGARRALPSLAVASSWRPGRRHELAVADSAGHITLIDVDSGRLRWGLRAPRDTFSLSWSDDGRRLLAVGASARRLYGASGQLLSAQDAAPGTRFVAGLLSPSGTQIALMRARGQVGSQARHDVILAPTASVAGSRLLITGHDLGDLRYSPSGRWLLVGWHRLDSWLFFATADGNHRMRVVSSISRRVGNREPAVEGWCCPEKRR